MSPGVTMAAGGDAAVASSARAAATYTLSGVTVVGLSLPEDTAGELRVTPTHLEWTAAGAAAAALALPFQDITLHAVQRAAPPPCIYCQVCGGGDELRLVPAGRAGGAPPGDDALDALFAAMCASAALCVDEDEGEGGDGGADAGAPADARLWAAGAARLDDMLVVPPELRAPGDGAADAAADARFEDADEAGA